MVAYDMEREQYIQAHGCDISRGGMAFESEEYVDPLLSVWLSFSIPEPDGTWRRLEAEGAVVNVSDLSGGCRFGVAYTRMTPEDRVALEAFIDRLEAEALEVEGRAP
jgi:c-di-GMP-binding flagellar brake protein YcgR